MREKIPRRHGAWVLWYGWVYITSGKHITQDFNAFDFKNLQNTKDVKFQIYDDITQKYRELEIPLSVSEKLGEYFRNRKEIESNEQYRLPRGLHDTPVNCASFVHYIKWWFENRPRKFDIKYIKTPEDESDIKPWDVLYIHEWDEWTGEYWHYMIYIGEGFCISKDGKSHLIVTRHHLKWLYKMTYEY